MEKNTNKAYLFFTVIIIALAVFAGMLFFNMERPVEETMQFKDGAIEMEKGISVTIKPRGGSDGSWMKTMPTELGKEKLLGAVFDVNVKSSGLGEVNDWSLKIIADKRLYLNKAWTGDVEVHQLSSGKEQRLSIKNFPSEEVELVNYVDGKEMLIELKPGDYFIYYPNKASGEAPLSEGVETNIGLILYTPGIGGYHFNDCEVSYVINSDVKNRPEFYIILILGALFLLMVCYFGIVLGQKKHAQTLYEKEKIMVYETMSTFVGFVDAKDAYTAGHSERVAIYTRLLAQKMGYSEDDATQAYYCALLHDAGKIAVPESILKKPGKLDDEEFDSIKQHTLKGFDILRNLKTVPMAAIAARNHHERYDGKGYPDKLKGTEIPEIARIIGVADAFDAMNSNRVYRKALKREDIIEQLKSCRGSQFDPDIADIFLGLLEDGTIDKVNEI